MAKWPSGGNVYPVTPKAYPVLPKAYPGSGAATYPSSGPPPVNPSTVAGYCWDLDADLGITYGAGGAGVGLVAQVNDQSSTAAHVAQAVGAQQPLRIVADASFNGHNSIDHTTLDSQLSASSSLALRHVFIVARYPGTTFATQAALLTHTLYVQAMLGDGVTASWKVDDDVPATRIRDGVTTDVALSTTNAAHVHESLFDALDTSTTWTVGGYAGALVSGLQWAGRWTRVVGFNVPVTGTDLAGVRAFLKARYGTP